MSIENFQEVALVRDFLDKDLRCGDIGVVVDRVPHPSGGEDGFLLEIFNAVGESLRTVAVAESDVEALHAREVLMVRPL